MEQWNDFDLSEQRNDFDFFDIIHGPVEKSDPLDFHTEVLSLLFALLLLTAFIFTSFFFSLVLWELHGILPWYGMTLCCSGWGPIFSTK